MLGITTLKIFQLLFFLQYQSDGILVIVTVLGRQISMWL